MVKKMHETWCGALLLSWAASSLKVVGFSLSVSTMPSKNVNNIIRCHVKEHSRSDNSDDDFSAATTPATVMTRRDLVWKVPLVSVATYGYGKVAYNAFSVQGISKPEEHERRIRDAIALAFQAASNTMTSTTRDTFRVLEVGIGNACRVARRGLYRQALCQLVKSSDKIRKIEMIGLDLQLPSDSVLQKARKSLSTCDSNSFVIPVELHAIQGSITNIPFLSKSFFPSGYFDCIVCCLTLCSVDDPLLAVTEMNRLLRSDGGTMAFVEHVAVDLEQEKDYQFLEWQQRQLDGLQQALASNCHLHRNTDEIIENVFISNDHHNNGKEKSVWLSKERFVVNAMWPTSMQSCGVLQRREQKPLPEPVYWMGQL